MPLETGGKDHKAKETVDGKNNGIMNLEQENSYLNLEQENFYLCFQALNNLI